MKEYRGRFRVWSALIGVVVAAALVVPATASASLDGGSHRARRTPVVVFPAFHFTKLEITVRDQVVAPECPRSGTFEDWFRNDNPSTTFSQVCQDKLMTLRISNRGPKSKRFRDQQGVTVAVKDYGTTESAPFYEPMYEALEAVGYVRDRDIRVAGYDSRLTPDMRHFVQQTKQLIVDTYRDNGRQPVHLVGHSNGPLYAQYLLTHTSRKWKHRYIHGFTPIAGNFPGQGLLYPLFFTGLNVTDFTFPTTTENAESSALMYLSAPSSYMSASDPRIFDSLETVVEDASTGRSYTRTRRRRGRRNQPRTVADCGRCTASPTCFEFFQAVRLLARMAPRRARGGPLHQPGERGGALRAPTPACRFRPARSSRSTRPETARR